MKKKNYGNPDHFVDTNEKIDHIAEANEMVDDTKPKRPMTQEKKETAVEWFIQNIPDIGEYLPLGISLEIHSKYQQALDMEKEQMLEFGSRVTDRWGLTQVEPHYINDEYNKYYGK